MEETKEINESPKVEVPNKIVEEVQPKEEIKGENIVSEEQPKEETKVEEVPDTSLEDDKKHLDKLNEAYNKISELEDKLIRKDADMINYRKRKEEEVNKMLKFCNEDIIKEILPILDNFERAIVEDDSKLSDVEKNYLVGFKMIYSHLINVMEKFDVKPIDGNNKPFDPVYHNAIMSEKREGVAPGMVIEVLQKGYLLKDKVIRTAMVRVSE